MSSDVGLTFLHIKNGISTARTTDNNSCKKLGLKVFAPRTKTDYESARKYLLSIKKPGSFGPLACITQNLDQQPLRLVFQ
jgi:hypothetical protein